MKLHEEAAEHELGWCARLDRTFPHPVGPFYRPRLKQMLPILAQLPGILKYTIMKKWNNESIPMDHSNLVPYKPIYGAPIGGIGSGTIGRAFGGAFCRFQMLPGHYAHEIVEADQFILRVAKSNGTAADEPWQQALCVAGPHDLTNSKKPQLLPIWKRFEHRDKANYRAIYPRSWTTYDLSAQCGVEATCRQISPVIPNDYADSTLPCGVFVWDLKNTSNEDLDISLAFAFKNGVGEAQTDRSGGAHTASSQIENSIRCSAIFQKFRDMNTQYLLAVQQSENVQVSHLTSFNPLGDGADLWQQFAKNGKFASEVGAKSKVTGRGEEIGTAVAGSCFKVPAGQSRQIVFVLAWHQPDIHFNTAGHFHKRRYTRFVDSADALVARAFASYKKWESAIEQWQRPILADSSLPKWLRSALFNELYFVADGGTIWVEMTPEEIEKVAISPNHKKLMEEFGRFAYLEGHEYKMLTTYDVHFNASFALVQLWPNIQLSIQYEFASATRMADDRQQYFAIESWGPIKVAGCVPHDLGDPDNDPWLQTNAYFVHRTDDWKDLNVKFILQTWRDYAYTKQRMVIEDIYPVCYDLAKRCLREWDKDQDGLIENGGKSDQTYDIWVMTGPSAYCGGLWLGALRCCQLMARELGKADDEKFFADTLKRASEAYETKLWNGKYYNFDCSKYEAVRTSVMADQLSGYWYLRMCDLVLESKIDGKDSSNILPDEHIDLSLTAVLENNFRAVENGKLGVVNGALPNRRGVDTFCLQSEEIWTGVNYGLAALLIANNRGDEGYEVAKAVYDTVYESMGLGFQTPEAYNTNSKYRSLGYMRPLAIWSIFPAANYAKLQREQQHFK